MRIGELITVFRTSRTKDTKKPYLWPDSELIPFFAEAEDEAALRAKLLFDTDELSVSSGETSIDLPEKLFDIQYAELRDADGKSFEITGSSRQVLDSTRPGWRGRVERPREYVHDDKTLALSAIPDQGYTLYLEFYRLPKRPVTSLTDAPEIHDVHHLYLIEWVLHKAYSKPDADTLNPGAAAKAEGEFTRQFGFRPNADMRRRQNANRPHRNATHT